MNRRRRNLRQPGSLGEVISLSWPIIIGLLSYTAMSVSDMVMMGWLGTTAVAGVGLASTVAFIVLSFFYGTLKGVKIAAAQADGAHRRARSISHARHGFVLAIPFGLAVVLLGQLDFYFFLATGAEQAVVSVAREYFAVRIYGALFYFMMIAFTEYFQGVGDTRLPMKLNIAMNGLNIMLSALLVFGPGPIPALGVVGAAWGTVLASLFGLLLAFAFFFSRHGFVLDFRLHIFRRILRLGFPVGVRFVFGTLGFGIFTAVVARSSEVELAASQISLSILSISFLPGHGIAEAATILTGRYHGAGKPGLIVRSHRNALLLGSVVMGAMGLFFWLLPGLLFWPFGAEAEVVAVGRSLLLLAAVFQVFDAVAMITAGSLNGAGDVRFTMWVGIAGTWLILVPASLFLGLYLGLGAVGAWIALTVEVLVIAALMAWRFRQQPWKLPTLA